jgi:hypothetical protein
MLDDGNWHHYVVTFTRLGDGVFYIDDGQLTTQPDPLRASEFFDDRPLAGGVGNLNAGFPVNVMQDGTANYTDGGTCTPGVDCADWNNATMCDLAIWRRALSADEVDMIYKLGLQGISAVD